MASLTWARRTREGHSDRCTALALALHASRTSLADGITDPSQIRYGGYRPSQQRLQTALAWWSGTSMPGS